MYPVELLLGDSRELDANADSHCEPTFNRELDRSRRVSHPARCNAVRREGATRSAHGRVAPVAHRVRVSVGLILAHLTPASKPFTHLMLGSVWARLDSNQGPTDYES